MNNLPPHFQKDHIKHTQNYVLVSLEHGHCFVLAVVSGGHYLTPLHKMDTPHFVAAVVLGYYGVAKGAGVSVHIDYPLLERNTHDGL